MENTEEQKKQDLTKFEYEVKLKADTLDEYVIEKRNITTEFSLGEIIDMLNAFKSKAEQARRQIVLPQAIVAKHEEKRPFLGAIPRSELKVYKEYIESRLKVEDLLDAEKTILREVAEIEEELLFIGDKIGVDMKSRLYPVVEAEKIEEVNNQEQTDVKKEDVQPNN